MVWALFATKPKGGYSGSVWPKLCVPSLYSTKLQVQQAQMVQFLGSTIIQRYFVGNLILEGWMENGYIHIWAESFFA